MRGQTRKIAIASVSAALAAPCIIVTNFVPLSVTLLTVACVCYYIAFDKAGIAYGFVAMMSASGLSFLGGLGMAQMLNAILFAPYAVLAFFMRRFQFGNIRHMVIRAGIVVIFAVVSMVPIYYLAGVLTGLDLSKYTQMLPYAALVAIFAACMIAIDIMFSQMVCMLSRRIKIGDSGRNNDGSED